MPPPQRIVFSSITVSHFCFFLVFCFLRHVVGKICRAACSSEPVQHTTWACKNSPPTPNPSSPPSRSSRTTARRHRPIIVIVYPPPLRPFTPPAEGAPKTPVPASNRKIRLIHSLLEKKIQKHEHSFFPKSQGAVITGLN